MSTKTRKHVPVESVKHLGIYTADPHVRRTAWRSHGVKLDGERNARTELDVPLSRHFEVRVLGPSPLRILSVPDAELVAEIPAGEVVVIRERAWLTTLTHCDLHVAEFFNDDGGDK